MSQDTTPVDGDDFGTLPADQLEARIHELENQLGAARDEQVRLLAEMDNQRKRAARDTDTARKFGVGGMPGRHNVENVVAAITIALLHGAGVDEIKQGVSSFTGVKRRFDYQIKSKDAVYIDDYAHHPSEIEAAIKSAKELYPGMHTTVIFQPHLYSRTRDFADGFASSLSLADTTILLPIYPARELPIANVNSEMIKNKMTGECELCEKSDLLEMLTSSKTALVMTLGAARY